MHSVHFILVHERELDSIKDFDWKVKVADSLYPDNYPEDGDTWHDWWEIGGRWSNEYEDIAKSVWPNEWPNKYVLPVGEYRAEATKKIETVLGWQQREIDSVRRTIQGGDLPADYVSDWYVGQEVSAADRKRWQEMQDKDHREFKQLLTPGVTLEEYSEENAYSLASYKLRMFCKLIDGDWFSDSHFYDCVSRTANPTRFLQFLRGEDNNFTPRYSDATYNINDLYLVVVDFHS
jgi:hypothetical protein